MRFAHITVALQLDPVTKVSESLSQYAHPRQQVLPLLHHLVPEATAPDLILANTVQASAASARHYSGAPSFIHLLQRTGLAKRLAPNPGSYTTPQLTPQMFAS